MRITFDTNITLDVLLKREPFAAGSIRTMRLAEAGDITGFMTANTVTDIAYILGRQKFTGQQIRESLRLLISFVKIIDVSVKDIQTALISPIEDFEDALLSSCAKRVKSDYILTRNEKDFKASPVAALTPEAFLDIKTV